MKYEILKKDFDEAIFYLVQFQFKFRLNGHIDNLSIKELDHIIEVLRYYRQFSK